MGAQVSRSRKALLRRKEVGEGFVFLELHRQKRHLSHANDDVDEEQGLPVAQIVRTNWLQNEEDQCHNAGENESGALHDYHRDGTVTDGKNACGDEA